MNTAEWIIVVILSVTLFVFLVIGIILFIKLINLTKEAETVIKTSQKVAEKTGDVVDNVKDFTSIGGIFKAVASRIANNGVEIDLNKRKASIKPGETVEKPKKKTDGKTKN